MSHSSRTKDWRWVLLGMTLPVLVIALWPTPVDEPFQGTLSEVLSILHSYGAPPWFNYALVETSANVLLFVPFGVVASLALIGRRWWQVGAAGLVISGCIEFCQLMFLQNRFSSPMEMIANTGGAFLGAFIATRIQRVNATRSHR